MTAAERKQRMRERDKAQGLVRIEVKVPAEYKKAVKDFERELQEKGGVVNG